MKRSIIVKINVTDEFERRREMEALLLRLLGSEAEITIELVDDIPVLASGKRKYIANKMN